MPVLTTSQAKQLSDALVNAFDPTTLAWMVRSSLGPELYAIVDTRQGLLEVIADLLSWAERRGAGTVEALLRGALSARPNHQMLRDFSAQHFPQTLLSLPANALVQNINLGLQLLIDMRDKPNVRQIVGSFRADFETTNRQIQILKQYKALHDSLHELQLALDAIVDSLNRSTTDSGAVRSLRMYALALTRWAREARAQTPGLPTKPVEDNWIDDFDTCIVDLNNAASPTACTSDCDKSADLPDRLRSLLDNATRINSLLASAADNLRLESFTQTMMTIASGIQDSALAKGDALQLDKSAVAVGVLHARLNGLVAEHNDWQVFSTQLEVAYNSHKHQPQARMPKWQQFKGRLTGLCNAYPESNWSGELRERLSKWIAETSSYEPTEVEKIAGDIAFAEFHRACIYRFFDVDKELNELAGQVTDVAKPLETLLAAIQ
jgi:hypothetical protein